ncbi:MAG: hypothetical protein CMF71_09590 [Magnetovibrio sp.]|nr:hypothetical protein [Magnetovibrio sp.]
MTEGACVGVFIATTGGPIEVQRITKEDPDIDSLVCLAGKAKTLPISSAYHDFVRQPSGVLHRDFGHGAYRVDLSATIEDGYSWQFGLYIAHALHAEEKLASDFNATNHVVFISGEVNIDLEILSVDHVTKKLIALNEKISNFLDEGKKVSVFLPKEVEREALAFSEISGVDFTFCNHINDAFAKLDLEPKKRSAISIAPTIVPERTSKSPTFGFSGKFVMLCLSLLIFALSSGFVWLWLETKSWSALEQSGRYAELKQELDTAAVTGHRGRIKAAFYRNVLSSPRSDFRIRLYKIIAPMGQSCAAIRFGVTDAVRLEVKRINEQEFKAIKFEKLCSLEFVAVAGDADTFLWGRYSRYQTGKTNISDTVALGPSSQELRWKIELPRYLSTDYDLNVFVIASSNPIDGSDGWVAEQISETRFKMNTVSRLEIAEKFRKRGLTLKNVSARLIR